MERVDSSIPKVGKSPIAKILRRRTEYTPREGIRLPFHSRDKCVLRKGCTNYSRMKCRGLTLGCNSYIPTGPIVLKNVWATNDGEVVFTDSLIGIWAENGHRIDVVVSIHDPKSDA